MEHFHEKHTHTHTSMQNKKIDQKATARFCYSNEQNNTYQ